jgi:predicted RNA-binding Zn ribbon-like protein
MTASSGARSATGRRPRPDRPRHGRWERLKACPRDPFFWAFYDRSKNRPGRWCRMEQCGTIEKARAFRERRRGART